MIEIINKYNELTQYVPKQEWENDNRQQLIYEKLTNRLNWLENIFEEIVNNAFIKTANEETIAKLEKEFGVHATEEMTLDDRRSVLLAKLRGLGVTNIERLKAIGMAFLHEDDIVDVIEHNPEYYFTMQLSSEHGFNFNKIDLLDKSLQEIKPAHLGVNYKLKAITKTNLGIVTYGFTGEVIKVYPWTPNNINSKVDVKIPLMQPRGLETIKTYPAGEGV